MPEHAVYNPGMPNPQGIQPMHAVASGGSSLSSMSTIAYFSESPELR